MFFRVFKRLKKGGDVKKFFLGFFKRLKKDGGVKIAFRGLACVDGFSGLEVREVDFLI